MEERTDYVPDDVVGEVNRDEQSERAIRFLEKLHTSEITGSEESKKEFIRKLDFEGFKRLLLTLNGNLMAVPSAKREFFAGEMELAAGERENKFIALAEGSEDTYTPLQEDKDELLNELFDRVQEMASRGASTADIALLIGTGINAIHTFKDGNGRTSRLLHYLMSENYQGTEEQKKYMQRLLGKKGRLMVDLNPSHANEEITSYIQQEKFGVNGDKRVRVLYTNKLSLNENINQEVVEDFKRYIFSASAFESARGLGALATYSVLKTKPDLLQLCRYGDDDTRINAEKLGKHVTQKDLEQILKAYWELKKDNVKILFEALSQTEDEESESSGLPAVKKAFFKNRDESELDSIREVNQQELRPVWARLSHEHYKQQEIPAAELSAIHDIRAKARELSEKDAQERAALNFDFEKAKRELEDFRTKNRVDIERDPKGYNEFSNKLFDKERELYAPLLEISEKHLQDFILYLDRQSIWTNKFVTRNPYEHTTEDRRAMTDSLYYVTPSGCSLRLLRYSLGKEGLKTVIQPFMEQVIYLDENGRASNAPAVGLSPVEYVTDDFWEALKTPNSANFTSRIKKYELDGEAYYINPNDGDLHKAYPIIKVGM